MDLMQNGMNSLVHSSKFGFVLNKSKVHKAKPELHMIQGWDTGLFPAKGDFLKCK